MLASRDILPSRYGAVPRLGLACVGLAWPVTIGSEFEVGFKTDLSMHSFGD